MSKNKVRFDRNTIDAAIEQHGLSHVRVARELGVPLRTWMRWMEDGDVPVGHVTNLVLLLEIGEPEGLPAEVPRTPWLILRAMEDVRSRLGRIEQALEEDDPRSG